MNHRVGGIDSHLRLTLQSFTGQTKLIADDKPQSEVPEYEFVEAMHSYIKSKHERDT